LIKKDLTYNNVDGQQVTDTAYFHLTKADLIEMEVSMKGGLQAHLQRVIDSEDGAEIIKAFKMLIRRSYGQRTAEGRFVKDPAKTEEFMSSEAYSELFMSLVTDADAAAQFVNGIVPKGVEEDAAKIEAANAATAAAVHHGDACSGQGQHGAGHRRGPDGPHQPRHAEGPHRGRSARHGSVRTAGRPAGRPLQALLERGVSHEGVSSAARPSTTN
jgi:hypothetical protein